MNETHTVLLVDDEEAIVEGLASFLSRTGFNVLTAANGSSAISIVENQQPAIMVLDVLMPYMDGREVLRRLRGKGCAIPVILLTQIGDSTERAMAIEEGADDYLNKPFDPHELVARLRAILRRTQRGEPSLTSASRLICQTLNFDRAARRVRLGDVKLALSPRATHLLEFMLLHSDELLTRERLLDAVWGWDFATGTRSVDARVTELRKALNDDKNKPTFIETVPGEGYRFIGKVVGTNQ